MHTMTTVIDFSRYAELKEVVLSRDQHGAEYLLFVFFKPSGSRYCYQRTRQSSAEETARFLGQSYQVFPNVSEGNYIFCFLVFLFHSFIFLLILMQVLPSFVGYQLRSRLRPGVKACYALPVSTKIPCKRRYAVTHSLMIIERPSVVEESALLENSQWC